MHSCRSSDGYLHRIAEHADPTREQDVKAARRTLARGRNAPDQKAPLRWVDIQKALATLGNDPPDLRAKAMIAVAYSTLARRAELIDIRIEDITFGTEGDGTVTLRTKGGDQKERYLASEARHALEAWLDFARINDGFRCGRFPPNGFSPANRRAIPIRQAG
jgi:integrase